jgi:hypothetical protein
MRRDWGFAAIIGDLAHAATEQPRDYVIGTDATFST